MKNNINDKIVQYLFFKLNGNDFAIKAHSVKEIVDYVDVTVVPKANLAIKGITNIRGDIVPIIDPKVRFNMENTGIGKRTSFIILNIYSQKKEHYFAVGLMVDFVNEVDDINTVDILPTPQFGTMINNKYIENMIRYEYCDDYVTVLDIQSVIDIVELAKGQK